MADIANEIYATRWEAVNQSLQELHDSWKRRYDTLESRRLSPIDQEAIRTKYQSAYDEIVEY